MRKWLESLTTQQLRALACQAGLTGWKIYGRDNLLDQCQLSDEATLIYKEVQCATLPNRQ